MNPNVDDRKIKIVVTKDEHFYRWHFWQGEN